MLVSLILVFAIGLVIGILVGRECEAEASAKVEKAPPEQVEVAEEKRFYYNCPLDHDLQDYIRELCDNGGVPMAMVLGVIEVESNFDSNAVSATGDYGLMQINKINHGWMSEELGITDFLDPYQNVLGGITMLSDLYGKYRNPNKVLMAYNLGEAGAKKLWDMNVYSTGYSRKVLTNAATYELEETIWTNG